MIISHTIIFKIRILIDRFSEQFKTNILCHISFSEICSRDKETWKRFVAPDR